MVFVCENNLYGEFSRIDQTTPFENLALRGAAYAMSSVSVDGNDVIAVRTATAEAVERARNGGGPSFIECRTYRRSRHSVDRANIARPANSKPGLREIRSGSSRGAFDRSTDRKC